jgi:hypothetical protein
MGTLFLYLEYIFENDYAVVLIIGWDIRFDLVNSLVNHLVITLPCVCVVMEGLLDTAAVLCAFSSCFSRYLKQ